MSSDAPFTHRTGACLRLDDAEIYYEQVGSSELPALLLLHGGLGNLCDMNPVAAELAGRFRLIGMDFRGHGRSTLGPLPLTYERYEQDVVALLQQLGIDSFSLLGFSDGGIVGYRLASRLGARIRALVTVGAQWRLSAADPAFELLNGVSAEMWEAMFPASRSDYDALNPFPDFARLVRSAVALWTDLGPSGYPGDSVRKIAMPTLIVRGDNDFLLSLGEAAALRAALPVASLFNVPLAGHEVHKDSPTLFMAAVADFLSDPRTPPSEP